MPIKVITGTPGAGKTLSALEEVCKAVGVNPRDYRTADELIEALRNRQDTRPVFVSNVEGLKPGIFEPLPDPLNWQDCPDGSLILVDEVWQFLGSHLTEAKKDERVLALAKHRHRGFDFVFTCQQPSQLSSFVRGLVGDHVHVSRKFGTNITERFHWPAMCEEPNSLQQRKRGSGGIPWTYPPSVFGLYQSATLHTVKRKLPLRVLALPVLALAALGAIGFGAMKVKAFVGGDAAPVPAAQRSEQPAAAAQSPGQPPRTATPEEWIAKHVPRVPGMPWSAPIYDNRPPVAEPRLLCYISFKDTSAGRCRCVTERGSRYEVDDATCRHVAEFGEPYNPYRREGRILATDSGRPENPEPQSAPVVVQGPQAPMQGPPQATGGAVIAAPPIPPTASWGAGS